MTSLKLCKDCAHFAVIDEDRPTADAEIVIVQPTPRCVRPGAIDPVYGHTQPRLAVTARAIYCGAEGKWWEPK